jgi:hypothetical protein
MKTALIALLLAITSFAADTKLENGNGPEPVFTQAKVEPRPAPNLATAIDGILKQPGQPLWVGYAVPLVNKPNFICCFDSVEQFRRRRGCCSGCRLESDRGSYFNSNAGTCVSSTPPTHFFVMMRVVGGQIQRIRTFTPDCGLDAGGKTVVWLTGVNSGQSIAFLERIVSNDRSDLAEDAVSAIGLHADPLADKALERLISATQPESMREDAAFWLGSQRGRTGYEIVRNLLRNDADPKFREHAIFVVSESNEKDAIPEIIRVAKVDPNSDVRGQALFWLAQKASEQAESAITEAMEKDPDADVKRKAVFALSQLPPEQGVPLLIKYAESRNPVVRKEAIFWLGESEDPRALVFLERFLLQN